MKKQMVMAMLHWMERLVEARLPFSEMYGLGPAGRSPEWP
jgi:hypothetical protein